MLDRVRRRWPTSRIGASNLLWWLASRTWTRWVARDFDALGEGTVLLLPCVIHGAERMRIGRHVDVGPMCRFGALDGARLSIGDGCEFAGGTSVFAQGGGIEIGSTALFGWNVQIFDTQHENGDRSRPIRAQGIARPGKVVIAEGAWLGANVIVLPGVTIGRNAVIGANSVVTRDVPDYATAVGAPARVIRGGDDAQAEASGPK